MEGDVVGVEEETPAELLETGTRMPALHPDAGGEGRVELGVEAGLRVKGFLQCPGPSAAEAPDGVRLDVADVELHEMADDDVCIPEVFEEERVDEKGISG
ncbi:MAG: hypothetical protein IJ241_00280, partial [Clostridia bacterium]|nr:hypothetical protein [Clostridia bacterium]